MCLIGLPLTDLLEQEGWRPALFSEIVAAGTPVSDAVLAERQTTVAYLDPAMILYTSGTTGSPKGAVLSHRGLLNNGWLMARRWGLEQSDQYSTPMPFFHAGGCVSGILAVVVFFTLVYRMKKKAPR